MNKSFLKSKATLIAFIEVLAGFILTFIFYDKLPDMIPIHWGTAMKADRFASKASHAYYTPIVNLGLFIFFLIVPMIDPKKENYHKSKKPYNVFRILIHTLALSMQLGIIISSLGYKLDFAFYGMLIGCIIEIVLGNYFSTIKFNYTFGVKTPWTLANEYVWKKTHKVMGYIYVTMGIVNLVLIFILSKVVWGKVMMYSFIASIIFAFMYSFAIFNNQEEKVQ